MCSNALKRRLLTVLWLNASLTIIPHHLWSWYYIDFPWLSKLAQVHIILTWKNATKLSKTVFSKSVVNVFCLGQKYFTCKCRVFACSSDEKQRYLYRLLIWITNLKYVHNYAMFWPLRAVTVQGYSYGRTRMKDTV